MHSGSHAQTTLRNEPFHEAEHERGERLRPPRVGSGLSDGAKEVRKEIWT